MSWSKKMTEQLHFFFSFNNDDHLTLGRYFNIVPIINIQLDSIAKSNPYYFPILTSLFFPFFKQIHDELAEPFCIDRFYKVFEHELLHHALKKAGCPMDKHHYATNVIEWDLI